MKKNHFFSLSLFAGILLVAFLANPVYAQTPQKTATTSIPKDVYAVFKNSCMVCHGTGGGQLTLSVLNFSKWDQYKTAQKAKKAAAICVMITKGVMPPQSFQKANPMTVLTTAQKELICNWSRTVISAKK